jgi:hypothetical protein
MVPPDIRRLLPLVGAIVLLAVAGCRGDAAGGSSSVTVDTLEGGAIHVQNAGAGAWSTTPDARWRVTEDLRIGRRDGSGADVFGRVGSVVVDPLDRLWVVDGLANELRVFDAEGNFVRTVGRRGAGPGEFMQIGPAFTGPHDEIWVEDLSLARWERFDTTGARVGGIRSTSRLRGALRLWTRDGRLVVVDSHPTDPDRGVFVEHRLAGPDSLVTDGTYALPEITAPELVRAGAGAGMPLPFAPLPWMEVSQEGEAWVSHGTSAYVIHRQTIAGDTLLVIERAYDPVPVPDSMRQRVLAEIGLDANSGDARQVDQVPRVHPPFDEFHVSADGFLWVRRSLAEGAAGFDVFNGDGRFLGQPEVPDDLASMRIKRITATHLYAVATDRLGVDYVVRLAVRRPGEL